jgi:tRNA threonylcarbamoyladenosine biosynthesis protein TsaB
MLILAVDTSTRQGSLALLHDADVLEEHTNRSDATYSDRLIPDVHDLLEKASISLTQIDLFAAASGPGSFTGLRVGLTAVKAWAEVFGKAVAGVSGLHAIAAQVRPLGTERDSGLVAPVLDARRGQIFGGLYKRQGAASEGNRLELLGEEVVASPEEFIAMVSAHAAGICPVFASPTPNVIAASLACSTLRRAQLAEVSGVLAPVVGRLAHLRALRGEVVDALRLDANYVRRSDAELNWKGAWGAPKR